MARAIDIQPIIEEIKSSLDISSYSEHDKGFDDGLEYVLDLIEKAPTLTPPNEWVSVEKGFPELPDASWCSRSVIVCDKDGDVAPLLWARAQVRGKTVERWKYHWGRIYDGPEITHWMPLPAPPGKDNNVPTKAQNEPLTIKQLREMDGEPVYDYLGQEWYVIQEYYGHELTMTDGTRFFDDDEIDGVDKRFYRRPPEVQS